MRFSRRARKKGGKEISKDIKGSINEEKGVRVAKNTGAGKKCKNENENIYEPLQKSQATLIVFKTFYTSRFIYFLFIYRRFLSEVDLLLFLLL